jgi:hypothetical protein
VVPGAHHVGARDTDTDGYFERVERFMRAALTRGASVAARPTY